MFHVKHLVSFAVKGGLHRLFRRGAIGLYAQERRSVGAACALANVHELLADLYAQARKSRVHRGSADGGGGVDLYAQARRSCLAAEAGDRWPPFLRLSVSEAGQR